MKIERISQSKERGFLIDKVRLPTRVIMAPMAGLTDGPFRRVAAEAGCRAFWTEMLPAEGLVRKIGEVMGNLPGEDEPLPLAVQIFGHKPRTMAEAAAIVEERGASLVDINMACPAKKIVRIGAGVALMKDPEIGAEIVKAVVEKLKIPVTVKIRTGWDEGRVNALAVARKAIDAGAAAVIIHGRTRRQGFSGRADHQQARILKERLSVPIIVSGDITGGAEAEKVLGETGADGVMIGRAAIGDPWMFKRAEEHIAGVTGWKEPSGKEKIRVIKRHLSLMIEKYGPRRGVLLFRPHLLGYIKGQPGISRVRSDLVREMDVEKLLRKVEKSIRDWE